MSTFSHHTPVTRAVSYTHLDVYKRQIDKVLKETKHFRNFIAEIGLLVKTPNWDTSAVKEDNIVGLNDAIDFLRAKRKLIASQYNQIQSEVYKLEKERR